jgi:hypothetical protein
MPWWFNLFSSNADRRGDLPASTTGIGNIEGDDGFME